MVRLPLLAYAVLSLLSEGPSHPYELHRVMVERETDSFLHVRPGTLYNQVKKLVKLGLADVRETQREGNRPERTLFGITEQGRAELSAGIYTLLADPSGEVSRFRVGLSAVSLLGRDEALAALRERREALAANQAHLRQSTVTTTALNLPERWLLDITYELASLDAQTVWLDDTISRLAAGDLEWDGSHACRPDLPASKGHTHDR